MANKASSYDHLLITCSQPKLIQQTLLFLRKIIKRFMPSFAKKSRRNSALPETAINRSYRKLSSFDTIYPKIDSQELTHSALSSKRFLEHIDIQECVQKSNYAEDVKKMITTFNTR